MHHPFDAFAPNDVQDMQKSDWDKYLDANPTGGACGFLIQEKHYLPRVAVGARIGAINGTEITFEHQPCPKFRVVLPLS
jgi:hypothetical protein